MPALPPRDRGLRVLSLDGGGVRGLSTLYILDRLMYRLKPEADPRKRVKPCEVFDVIVGTSTGGLIAIMLGRLEMDVESCIEAYKDLARDIFTPRRRTCLGGTMVHKLFGSSTFSAHKLESGIKRIIRENIQCTHTAYEDEDEPLSQITTLPDAGGPVMSPSVAAMKDKSALEETPMVAEVDQRCKVFVCCTLDNSRPYRIRSYQSQYDPGLPFTIWQAARATSAAPTFFDPLKMKNIATLRDGGLRNNNPINEVMDEIRTEFDGREISCLVSIGTGVCKTEFFGKSLISVAKACAKIATDTEQMERTFRSTHASSDQYLNDRYFRFEVEQGLQDVGMEEWRHMKRIWTVTTSYLDDPGRRDILGKCAARLGFLEAVPEPEPLIEEPRFSEAAIYHHEFLGQQSNEDFVGRETDMSWLEQKLMPKKCAQYHPCYRNKSVVVTLTGLGGSGKTQLMLRYAETHRGAYSAIFWVDCESEQSILESFKLIARLLNIGSATRINFEESQGSSALVRKSDIDDISSFRRWIQTRRHSWLLLFDNMADQSLTKFVTKALPVASTVDGHVIITSRRRLTPSGWLAREIGALDPASARDLLFRHARISHPTTTHINQADLITQELGQFPLSVSLAGSYIQVVETMDRYLIHYEERKRALLKKALGRSLPDGYPGSVFITWQTSLSLLPEPAFRFFRLLCALDRTNVSIDLLRRASSPKQRWGLNGELVTITPSENGVPDWFLKMCLSSDTNEWDELSILDHVFQLESLFFLRRETVEGSWLYDNRVAKRYSNGNNTSVMRIERFVQEIGRLMLEDTELQEYAAAAICIAIHSIEDDVAKSFRLRESSTNVKDSLVVILPTGGMSCHVHTLTLTLEECYRHVSSASECYPRLNQFLKDHSIGLFDIRHDSKPLICWLILSGIHLGGQNPQMVCQDETALGSAFAFAALALENELIQYSKQDNTIASWAWVGRISRLLEWQIWTRMCWNDGTKLSVERTNAEEKLTIKQAGPASFSFNFSMALACLMEAQISTGLTSNPFTTGDLPFQGTLPVQEYVDTYAYAMRRLIEYKLFPSDTGLHQIDNQWIFRRSSVDFREDIALTEPICLTSSDKSKYQMPLPPRSGDDLLREFQQSALYQHVRVGMAIVTAYWIRMPATQLLALPIQDLYLAK